MTDKYSIVPVDGLERVPGKQAGTEYVDMTEPLGSTELASRVWFLSPGGAVTYHRETAQEELYYVVDGPGRMRIDGDLVDVPEGGAVRVPPETPRQILNDTDEGEHVWLVVGTPKDEDKAEFLDV